ncbi:DUF2489 domain-containing protein [Ferrimonas pelagia]|uniref:DUF2489 domain-containing protein n=1 Tax=Ferrimonas pelagia TaxID=1177826 RepID=A0ABP9ELW3_9GAMM
MTVQGSMVLLAGLIIAVLTGYAAYLLWQLRQQRLAQQRAEQMRHSELQAQIQLIAKACHQQQCEPAEGALRLVNLLRGLPGSHPDQWRQRFPALHALYDQIAEQPILSARKALQRQERMRLDLELARAQQQLGPAMSADLARLADGQLT